jgi:cysteine synthase A
VKAKDLLDTLEHIKYVEIEPMEEHVQALKSKTNHTTYPFIFVGGEFVGGYTELYNMVMHGTLQKRLFDMFALPHDDDAF